MHLKNYHKLKETIFYESGYIDFSIYHAKLIEKTGGIVEERIYLGGYEVYRKTISGTLDFERQTLHISDNTKKLATIETKTVENGSAISTPISNIRYQYDNHLGSASLELDENAAIISYEEYHPFGTTSYRSGRTETEVSLKRYKYVGKERDEETGLYYYGARYYAGWIARFVSVDPLQFKYPHYTPFQYAGNKPISYIDLDGLEEAKINEAQVTHFFDNKSGKYLGQIDNFKPTGITESDLIDGMALRTISLGDYNAIKEYGEYEGDDFIPRSMIGDQSGLIRIDEDSFNAFNEIDKGGHIAGAPEKSLFMILDISDLGNPILRAKVNQNSSATNNSIADETQSCGDFSILPDMPNQIIIGQAHSHPLLESSKPIDYSSSIISFSLSEGKVNGPGVSVNGEDNDLTGAMKAGFPVYAIQSYDRSGKIYKVDQYGQLNSQKEGNKEIQIPVGNLNNLGTSSSQFNIILDAFLTNSNFKK